MERLLGILDGEEENRRLELVLETEGTPRLALKLATYSEGLGWHAQKTVYIEAQQVEELRFLLGVGGSLLKHAANTAQREETARPASSVAKVMNFSPLARKSA